ncbi:hypothetical protein CDD81_2680 [Ophiocordyceps australis]|uniref:Uncharacterized protein n=1 Tax=Ophiocordyceps australis TaxID=1399860 RepID=A0A2C5XEH8_9HYPO|nr:hypothetical protein CDD81_2680 [Ophiocordyceps australis]
MGDDNSNVSSGSSSEILLQARQRPIAIDEQIEESAIDIPFGKRESGNCVEGVVRDPWQPRSFGKHWASRASMEAGFWRKARCSEQSLGFQNLYLRLGDMAWRE